MAPFDENQVPSELSSAHALLNLSSQLQNRSGAPDFSA
jgi:hypothetical protein